MDKYREVSPLPSHLQPLVHMSVIMAASLTRATGRDHALALDHGTGPEGSCTTCAQRRPAASLSYEAECSRVAQRLPESGGILLTGLEVALRPLDYRGLGLQPCDALSPACNQGKDCGSRSLLTPRVLLASWTDFVSGPSGPRVGRSLDSTGDPSLLLN